MNKNSTRILISLSGFIVATFLLIGAIIGVNSIHRNNFDCDKNFQTTNLQTSLVVDNQNYCSLQQK